MQEEIKEVRRWGNSSGILLPRAWLGKQVKLILIDRTDEVKKEIFEILSPYLHDIQGIYLAGSRARGEHLKNSDIDIIAISNNIKKVIVSEKYNIEIYPLTSVKEAIAKNPIVIYPRLREAKPLLNKALLENLKNIPINLESFKPYIEECKRVIKINKGFIELDKKEDRNEINPQGIIYSLMFRLRGIYLIKKIIEKKEYSNNLFIKWLQKELGISKNEIIKAYEYYKNERDGKRIKGFIQLDIAESLLILLEKEVKKYEKKEKT